MRKRLFIVSCGLAGLMLGFGCGKQSNKQKQKTFKPAVVPSIYKESRLRAEYLSMHYWDHFDFADTAFVGSAASITEQAMVDYFSIFPYVAYETSCDGIKHMLDQAQKNRAMYAFFTSKMEQFLFNPHSPMRNEEFFIPVLEHMIASDSLDVYRKNRPKAILAEAQKNRPGMLAADIRYTMPNGSQGSLYNLKTDYVLIFFYHPDYREITATINASLIIKQMMEKKRLTVLAIYPDTDADKWKKYLPEMPQTWVHGYDKEMDIRQQKTYILRTVPALYLIDKEHKVIMKDAAFPYIELYLKSILNPPTQQQTTRQ